MSNPIELMTGLTQQQIDLLNEEINADLIKKNKYDKFGDGTYLSVDLFRRIMNETFAHAWSWEIIEIKEHGDIMAKGPGFILIKGRLSVRGVGIKEGFGIGKFDKADNSTAYSAANSFAFKNCCRMIGVGASVLDDDFDAPLLESEAAGPPTSKSSGQSTPAKTQPASKPQQEEPAAEKPAGNKAPAPAPAASDWTDNQLKRVDYIKKTYNIQTGPQMLSFAQLWNPKIKNKTDLTPEMFDKLYDYVEENVEEFENFDPSEVA